MALLACFLAGLVLIILRRLPGTIGFVVQQRRWMVERVRGMSRTGWFGRWCRLSKDYEPLPEVSEATVTLTAIRARKSMEGFSIACPVGWSMIISPQCLGLRNRASICSAFAFRHIAAAAVD
jgi:hypothetical protein